MPSVVEAHFCTRIIALQSLSARGEKERIACKLPALPRSHLGPPYRYCDLVASGLRNSRRAARFSAVGSFQYFRIGPTLAEAIFVRIAVLRDDGGDPLRMCKGEPQPNRRSVVEYVDREALESDCLSKAVDGLGQVLKRVAESLAVRGIGEAEAWQIWGNHVVAVGQSRNETAKHV
jgi:hypothetical protein